MSEWVRERGNGMRDVMDGWMGYREGLEVCRVCKS